MSSNKKIALFLVAFFIVLAAVFMTWFNKTIREAPRELAVIGEPGQHVEPFSFINQDGKVITNKDVAGKVYAVEYFFTTCKGICPKMNENMNRVYRAYRGNKNFMILSHSVDPKKDTVAAMKAYSMRFDADPKQWMFLTGDKQQLYNTARYSYLLSAKDDTAGVPIDQDFIHDKYFVLVDRTGHIRGRATNPFYDGTKKEEVDAMISDIRVLLEEKQ